MPERRAFPLPVEIEEIDADWLSAALRRTAPDASVDAVEILGVERGTCTRIRLRLELNAAARRAGIPDQVILKGGFEPHSRKMRSMHADEARGYRDVLPALKLPSPACYFADYDDERGQGVVIMEDLLLRGVRFCDALVPQTYEQVARQLAALARYHAQTWNSGVFRPGGAWPWITDTMGVIDDFYAPILTGEAWRRYSALPRAAAASLRFRDPEWLLAAMEKLKALAAQRPHCVLHGDTHQGNLYIDADGSPGFFDSLPHFGPTMWEITYHIVCALDPVDRRLWERRLVAHYLEELGRNGVGGLDLETALADYALWLARAYLVFVANDPVFQAEPVNTVYVARIGAAMLDHDTLGRIAAA
jgi:hypothetical protein